MFDAKILGPWKYAYVAPATCLVAMVLSFSDVEAAVFLGIGGPAVMHPSCIVHPCVLYVLRL